MPSPFPGVDPDLKNPESWLVGNSCLIVAIADNLLDCFSQKYRVEIEKRTYFSSDEESLLVGIYDVAVATRNINQSTSFTATLSLPIQPEKVTVSLTQEVKSRYLEIREIATGTVVTTIELLSPKNKRKGEG